MISDALLRTYLDRQHMMQLATCAGGRPWCATVYFVWGDDANFYWASTPERRHSRELAANPRVAAAIAVKFDKGEPVIGIQIEGMAVELPASPDNQAIVELYARRFGRDQDWVREFTAGRTNHRLYRLTPERIYLFDDVNFPGGERQLVR